MKRKLFTALCSLTLAMGIITMSIVGTMTCMADSKNEKTTFEDIADYGWAQDSINELYGNGILNGRSEKAFAPSENVTRAELTKMIMGIEESMPKEESKEEKIKVALVGDSLTQGLFGSDGKYTTDITYGTYLAEILGEKYDVMNFGISARGIYEKHKYPYRETEQYTDSLISEPDVVIIIMGTNDAKTMYWDAIKDSYKELYKTFVEEYVNLETAPKIIIGIPTPVFGTGEYAVDRPADIMHEMRETELSVAQEMGLETVKLNEIMKDKEALFPDGLHFNEEAGRIVATALADTVTGLTQEDSAIEFSDVKDTDWFAPYIEQASKMGIVNGNNGSFSPNNQITREDACVIVYRFLTKSLSFSEKKGFIDDESISDYAKDAISYLAGAGVVNGSDNGMFAPKNSLTRAEAAVLLHNVYNNIH